MQNKIEIFKSQDNEIMINVSFDDDTVWLNRQQIASLFDRDIKTIGKHIANIFREQELAYNSVVAKFATTAIDGKTYQVEHYNLDVIISIGYRVKSKRGTQFRQWATQKLKEHLIQGYTINQKRLQELNQAVQLIQQVQQLPMDQDETQGLLSILAEYTKTFILLNQFDSHNLSSDRNNSKITYHIDYNQAKIAIQQLKDNLLAKQEASELFGQEKDQGFVALLGNILQSFGGEYLYPSIEEQAAHLLYFIIKNHPFNDGNKRIGAFMFIWFLEKNKHRFKQSGELKINDNALVALSILIAQSNPNDKELIIALIINLINSSVPAGADL